MLNGKVNPFLKGKLILTIVLWCWTASTRSSAGSPVLLADAFIPTFNLSYRRSQILSTSLYLEMSSGDEYPVIRPDMKYIERNVRRQHENFISIRDAGGKEVTNDVYARDPSSDTWWFVGKVARISDVSLEECISRQWNLIEHHSTNLRPLELFPARGSLQIWTAPGDSEMDVAYNRPTCVFQRMPRDVPSADAVKSNFVGFQGEMYEKGEEGFRTWRKEDGTPLKPEIVSGPAAGASEDQEFDKIDKLLEGQDINALYEEQERRKRMNG